MRLLQAAVLSRLFSGKREVQEVILSPDVVDPDDIEMLQDLIVAAVNEELRKVEADSTAQLGSLRQDLTFRGFSKQGT